MSPLERGQLKADSDPAALNLSELRRRLRGSAGERYWRSLEELAASPQFLQLMQREFPSSCVAETDSISRRRFLRLMAASLALAGFTGCAAKPKETIVPYVRSPEEMVPGKPLFFATAMTLAGSAVGLLVESREGRPIKI
ncbi:MAG: TAT-variant-translocated molybdopterin oxidoreductase, partial [Acidobacteria bacterium]|nr:TAT-variant-translocated molybdopterin oxidoreductase [Acidobacteriota bacterium]